MIDFIKFIYVYYIDNALYISALAAVIAVLIFALEHHIKKKGS